MELLIAAWTKELVATVGPTDRVIVSPAKSKWIDAKARALHEVASALRNASHQRQPVSCGR
jgi:hypothetical protein